KQKNMSSRTRSQKGSHRCGWACLGPLTFHAQAVGAQVTLSKGGLLAERSGQKFNNGLVFSSRPVKVNERLRLRVERKVQGWHGALRVGFTTVPPTERCLPLPSMAIPNLTETAGHWAAPIPEEYCREGSEQEFWVSECGNIYFSSNGGRRVKLQSGVDLSEPLWAMIDIYGQTLSVLLLGSERKTLMGTRNSCPIPSHLLAPHVNTCHNLNHVSSSWSRPGSLDETNDCVACMEVDASVTLLCGHRCLCLNCATRVIQEIGTCPLCRGDI
uniref:Neuralized E3 ubiquitin protein ligase 3 n=1 Tax=Myripristis murdjan TaxID=586833 RepID=A0A668ATP0_9TELE